MVFSIYMKLYETKTIINIYIVFIYNILLKIIIYLIQEDKLINHENMSKMYIF